MGETTKDTRSVTTLHAKTAEAFNRRDWDALRALIAPDATYTEHALGVTAHGPDQIVDLLSAWSSAFSGARIEQPTYHEAGDVSVCCFVGRGLQDGALGPFPPSNNYAEIAFCEVVRFDGGGKIVAGEVYYDQLGMLIRLGHIPAPE